jgi:Tfp pilus assembly protein PilF
MRALALMALWGSLSLAAPLADDALIEDGRKQLEHGDVDAALASFARAEKVAPKDARPHFFRGAALAFKKDLAGAAASYRKAIALDPKFADAHLELGTLLLDGKKLDEALAEFKAAAQARPSMHEAWYDIAIVERDRKHFPEAFAAMKKAAELQPSVEISVEVAELARAKGDLAECEREVRAAIAKFPRSLRLRVDLTRVLAEEKKCDQAKSELSHLPAGSSAVAAAAAAVKSCKR